MIQETVAKQVELVKADPREDQVFHLIEQAAKLVDRVERQTSNFDTESARDNFDLVAGDYARAHPDITTFKIPAQDQNKLRVVRNWISTEMQERFTRRRLEVLSEQANSDLRDLVEGEIVSVRDLNPSQGDAVFHPPQDTETVTGKVIDTSVLLGRITLQKANGEIVDATLIDETEGGIRSRRVSLDFNAE